MQNTLDSLWSRYNLLLDFKNELNKKGYCSKNLFSIESQISLLYEFIEIESMNVLNDLLFTKTYLRKLKVINRGIENLPLIISDNENWILNRIEDDMGSWISKDILIFTCKSSVNVFSKISRKDQGRTYQNGKYQ